MWKNRLTLKYAMNLNHCVSFKIEACRGPWLDCPEARTRIFLRSQVGAGAIIFLCHTGSEMETSVAA